MGSPEVAVAEGPVPPGVSAGYSTPSPRLGQRALRRSRPLLAPICSATVLVLFGFILADRLPAALAAMSGVSVWPLIAASIAYLAAWYALAARLGYIVAAFGMHRSRARLFTLGLIGQFLNTFLPTSLAGDLAKAAYAADTRDRLAEAIVATFVDRGVGVVVVALIAAGAVVSLGGFGWHVAPVTLAIVGVGMMVLRSGLLGRAAAAVERVPFLASRGLGSRVSAGLMLARSPSVLLPVAGLTVTAHALTSLALWLSARSLGLDLSYSILFAAMAVLTLASMLPSMALVGMREVALFVVLRTWLPDESAIALGLTFSGVDLACTALGGLVFLARGQLGVALPAIQAASASR